MYQVCLKFFICTVSFFVFDRKVGFIGGCKEGKALMSSRPTICSEGHN